MYPYIGPVSLFGVGILLGSAVFFWNMFRGLGRIPTVRTFFFSSLGRWIFGVYLSGAYIYYLLADGVIFPLHRQQVVLYFSPFDFRFHPIGLLVACVVAIYWYSNRIPRDALQQRYTALCDAFLKAMMVVSPFLVLSDQFFGIGNKNRYSLVPLTLDSDRAIYEYVLPLGISIGLLSGGIYALVQYLRHSHCRPFMAEYIGYALWFLGITLITLFQVYPRHGVIDLFGMTRDIRQYIYMLVSVYFLYRVVSTSRQKN